MLLRSVIEEDEDEDDLDKFIGKLCFCGISLIFKILLVFFIKEIKFLINYEIRDFLFIFKFLSNFVFEILILIAKLLVDIKFLLDICYLV